jgi:hypothetical protein
MGRVVVTGWKPGFQKVQTNRLLRSRFGYSLDAAKYAVEDILEHRPVCLTVNSDEIADLCKELEALGAVYEIRDG